MGISQAYVMPKVALVTDDGLISISYRSVAGATGIDRGTSLSWARVWVDVTYEREIRSQSQRCERIDLNSGGS